MKKSIFFLFLCSPLLANDTGFKAPTVSGAGTWTSPDNDFTCNLTGATATTGQTQNWTTFTFGTIADSISGIEVSMTAQGAGMPGSANVFLSWDNGSSFTSSKNNSFTTGVYETKTYGGPSDLWGRTWTSSEFADGTFLFRIGNVGAGGLDVDCFTVKVYYSRNGVQSDGVQFVGVTINSLPFCAGNIATDNFVEAGSGDVQLNTHTADSGDTYVDDTFNGTNVIHIDRTNDAIKSTSTATGISLINEDLCSANYTATIKGRTVAIGSNRIGVVAHYDIATGTGYQGRITGGGGAEIRRLDGATQTIISSSAIAGFSASTNYAIQLVASGNVYTLNIDGSQAAQATDTAYANAGKVGVYVSGSSPRSQTTTDVFVAAY